MLMRARSWGLGFRVWRVRPHLAPRACIPWPEQGHAGGSSPPSCRRRPRAAAADGALRRPGGDALPARLLGRGGHLWTRAHRWRARPVLPVLQLRPHLGSGPGSWPVPGLHSRPACPCWDLHLSTRSEAQACISGLHLKPAHASEPHLRAQRCKPAPGLHLRPALEPRSRKSSPGCSAAHHLGSHRLGLIILHPGSACVIRGLECAQGALCWQRWCLARWCLSSAAWRMCWPRCWARCASLNPAVPCLQGARCWQRWCQARPRRTLSSAAWRMCWHRCWACCGPGTSQGGSRSPRCSRWGLGLGVQGLKATRSCQAGACTCAGCS